MTKPFTKHHPAICLISMIGILLTAADLSAAEPVPLSTRVVNETEGFLSDPARAGGLVGTIIGGAAIANPLAPILGSVIGYFIGKNTDFSNKNSKKAQRDAWANRSLIPSNDSQIASLSGLSGDKPNMLEGLTEEPSAANQPTIAGLIATPIASDQTTITALVEEPVEAEQPAIMALVEQPIATIEQPIILASLPPQKTEAKGTLQQQQLALAYACNNVGITQQLPVYCYYYSQ
jgi:hypothetical protein